MMNINATIVFGLLTIALTASCSEGKKQAVNDRAGRVSKAYFGETTSGDTVDQYTLSNANGLEMKVITLGGIITSLKTPDKEGIPGDIVLGFDEMDLYNERNPYFGALVGRYGNRIAKGKFSLDGTSYQLATNNNGNHLHGGKKGFDKVVWKTEEFTTDSGVGLQLSYLSKDMEEGYPGNLDVRVTYLLSNDDALEITYKATTDKKTIVNLTQHSYFNLSADPQQTVLDHKLMVNASRFIPVNNTLIPTGELREVKNTPFDFQKPKPVGEDIEEDNEQLKFGKGYDHCWVLNHEGDELNLAATLYHEESGRFVEVFTTEPGIQVYSGNFLNGRLKGKNNISYQTRSALCLETQHFPDSPNRPDFPSVTLSPDEEYFSKTVYQFSAK